MTNFVHRLCQKLHKQHLGADARSIRKVSKKLVFEALEPRLLLSADSVLGIAYLGEPSVTDAPAPPAIVTGLVDVSNAATFSSSSGEQQDRISSSSVAIEQTLIRNEIVFVDTSVEGYEQLVSDLSAQQTDFRRIEIRLLDGQRDGIEQISEVLANYSDLDAVHFLSHGTDGTVRLGATWLDSDSLRAAADSIGAWGAALSQKADLLFYGCDLAASAPGISLIAELSRLTGADVAASVDRTGASTLGGDWDLEFATGEIDTVVPLNSGIQQSWFGLLDTASLQASQDTYIKLRSPDDANNFGASTQLIVDRESTDLQRALLQFDFSSIPVNATINSATLEMQATQIGGTLNISVYEMLQPWDEGMANGTAGAANWTQSVTGTNWMTAGGSFDSTPVANLNTNSTGLHTWDITPLVQAWVNGSKVNNGLMVASPDGGGNRTVTYVSSEGTAKPLLMIDYTAVNNAPTLDTAKDPALIAISEDAGTPSGAVGTLVADLVDFTIPSGQVDNVTDPDTGALLGIAVTAADTTNGTWWYSINNGTNWLALGAVSNSNARLLAADASTRLYFQPNANYNGTMPAAITFHAWDQTSGTNGGTAAVNSTSTVLDQFNSVSYGNNDGTTNWSGNWVENDSNGGGSSGGRIQVNGGQLDVRADAIGDWIYREANLSGATSAALSLGYNNTLGSGDSIVIQVSNNGGASYSTLPGGTFSPSLNTGSGTLSFDITPFISANTRVRFYVATINANNHLYLDNVQISYTTTGGGSTAVSTANDTVSLTVNPINDTPTASNLSAAETYTLNTPLNLADIVISDIDSPNVTATLTLSDPGAGTLSTGTSGLVTSTYDAARGVWTASGAIADVNNLLASATYNPSLLYAFPFTIATSVDDGVAPAITGSKSMTMGPVNLPPLAANLNAAETYTEDTPQDLTDIVVTDLDSPNVTATLTLSDPAAGSLSTDTSGSVTSNYNAATGVWTASGAIADVNVLLAGVTFNPASNYNSNFTIGTSVDDGVAAPITGVKNMVGTAINDAPVLTDNKLTITEAGSVVLSGTELSAADVDNAVAGLTFTISGVSGGQFELVSNPGVAITTFTQGQVTGGQVRFVHDGGEAAPSYDVTVSDGALSDGPAGAMVNFTNQNDAPVLTTNTLTITEGGNVVLSNSELSAIDVDSGSLTFTVSGVSAGQFELISSPGVPITTFTQAQVSGGQVRFVHDGGEAAPSYDVTVSDGTLTDGPAAATISFTNQNDAPTATNLNAAESYAEDTPLNLTDIVIGDVDSANVTITLTLSDPGAGSLTTASSGSVTSTYNTATGVWRASGAIADVNALLAGVTFTPSANYNSNFTIATSIDDGVAAPITGVKSITGIAIDDAPIASNLSAVETYIEDTPLNLTDIVVGDVDSANVTATLTLSDVAAGSLSVTTSGSVTSTYDASTGIWTASGAIADVNVLLAGVTFTPSANYNSNFTIATSIDDGVAAPITGVKNMFGTAQNDAPLATNLNAAESYTEDTPLDPTDIVVSDVDSANVTVTLTLSDPGAGSLSTATSGSVISTYNAATGVWTASGAITDVNALLAGVTFTPSANYNSNFTIGTSVDDGVAAPITGVKNMVGTAINDAPVLTENNLTITEGGSVVLSNSELSATDVDSGSLTFTVSSVSGGQFELTSSPAVAITTFTQAQVSGGEVRFVHDGGEAAPSYDVSVFDGALSDGPATATISFTNQNDAPTAINLNAAETYTEDTALDLTNVVISDGDSANVTATLTLSDPGAGSLNTGTSGSVTSTYNAATGVWTASGAIADVNALLAGVTFTPAANYNSNFTIATSVDDGVAAAITGVKNMTGTAVNDAPTATNLNAAETYTEDTPLDLTDIVITDVDSANVTARLTLSDPGAGSLSTATSGLVTSTYNAATGIWTASGAIADVNALLAGVTFTPSANYNSNFTIATSVDDGVAATITGVKNMFGTAVNDAPTASNLSAAETYTLNTPLNLADIVISDVDSPNVTARLTLSDPGAGSLNTGTSGSVTSTYNAATGVWTASGAIADVNTLLANLTYTPSLLYLLPFTIATSVDDGIGPAITGSKSMTAALVNLPPSATNLNAAETYTEDTLLDLTNIVVSDLDSANVTARLILSDPGAGSLNTGTSGSVTSTYNAATGVWTASGAIADVNVLLAGVTFNPASNYNSNFTIGTSVDDGVAAPITGVKNMVGTAINDAPVLTDNNLTITEAGSVVLSGTELSAADVDNAVAGLTFTISGVSGGQFELVSNPGVAITSFTQAEVSGGDVRFVHDGGEAAPSYNVTVSDGALADGPAAATINFTNRDDAREPSQAAPVAEQATGQSPAQEPVPGSGGQGPLDNPKSTGRTGSTSGSGDATENPSLPLTPPSTAKNEFHVVVNTTEIQQPALISTSWQSSRVPNKPSSELRNGIVARTEVPSVSLDSDLEGSTSSTVASADLSSLIDIHGFVKELNQLRDEVREDTAFDKVVVGSTLALTTGFSVGYVMWLVHGEILLSSILASLPAWRLVDPLPVLSRLNNRSQNDADDDDSIESVIKKGPEIPESNQVSSRHRGSRSVRWRMIMQTTNSI